MAPKLDIPYIGQTLAHEGARIGMVEVSPELATAWLEHFNTNNRNISPRSVNAYVRDIVNSDWVFTGDPIQFSREGTLLNGQHRLTAISQTGVTVHALVVTGLDPDAQSRMDGGRKRSPGDVLAIKGMANYTTVAAIARLSLLWNPGQLYDSARSTSLSNEEVAPVTASEIVEFVNRHEAIHAVAHTAANVNRNVPGASPSVVGAAYLRAQLLPGGVFPAAEWFSRLETGAGLELGDPLLALRNNITRGNQDGKRERRVLALYRVVRAWNASQRGERLDRMSLPKTTVTNANFPDMLPPASAEQG